MGGYLPGRTGIEPRLSVPLKEGQEEERPAVEPLLTAGCQGNFESVFDVDDD